MSPPVPGQRVQLPPSAGSGAGHPGGHISQLVSLHHLHPGLVSAGHTTYVCDLKIINTQPDNDNVIMPGSDCGVCRQRLPGHTGAAWLGWVRE